jgi:hypothetical protein
MREDCLLLLVSAAQMTVEPAVDVTLSIDAADVDPVLPAIAVPSASALFVASTARMPLDPACGMEPDAAIAIAISTAMTTARRIPLDPVCGMEPDDAVAVPSTSELSTVKTARKMLLEHTQMRNHEVLLQAADSTNATNACSREWETEDA